MFDLGKEGNDYYISMEYVSGEDLKSTVRRVGPLSTGKAIFIAKQVCQGLSEAHRQGIIHRDLKPQNIMIDREGNVRVMDFGIARSMEAKGLTEDGLVMGTPEYMAPEQVEGRKADKRSDIYSMGVILYELATGQVPFDGLTPMSVASKHLTRRPREPRELNAQIPTKLNEVIMKCMEKDRGRRYQNIEELLFRLSEIERGMPSTDTIKPERKSITSKEIMISFTLRRLLIPVSIVIVVIAIGILTRNWLLTPKKEKELPLSVPSKVEILDTAQKQLKDDDFISKAPENSDKEDTEKTTPALEAQLLPETEQEEPVVKPITKEADQRNMDILAELDKGIESFNQGQYEQCIEQLEEVLKTDPDNESARHYLAQAKNEKKIKITQEEIADRIQLAQTAYQKGDYQECLQQSEKVLSLDPKNLEAKKFLDLANVKIIPGQIGDIIHLYIQSISENRLNDFYLNRCAAHLYQELKEEVELITSQYDNLKSQAADITLRFKENDRMEVRFSNITTGVSKKEKSQQVLFEGTYLWELEKQEGEWIIIDIKIQSPDLSQLESPPIGPLFSGVPPYNECNSQKHQPIVSRRP
jgi:tetratricopeptide (TPR) repeat protein